MTLSQYLKVKDIDNIEDDAEFCEMEYNTIADYFSCYEVTEDDIKELESRGYEESDFVHSEWYSIIIDGIAEKYQIAQYHDHIEAVLFYGSYIVSYDKAKYTLKDVIKDVEEHYREYVEENYRSEYRAYCD